MESIEDLKKHLEEAEENLTNMNKVVVDLRMLIKSLESEQDNEK
jgi:hypothetical protein